jgi:hypothetical protein
LTKPGNGKEERDIGREASLFPTAVPAASGSKGISQSYKDTPKVFYTNLPFFTVYKKIILGVA